MDTEAKTIRETELDRVGEYQEAILTLHQYDHLVTPNPDLVVLNGQTNEFKEPVFVDHMGRVILPANDEYKRLKSISFEEGTNGASQYSDPKKVVSIEPRFRGQKVAAYVVYLEDTE